MALGRNWIVSYEVYVLKRGRWSIDHAGPEGEAARERLQQILRRGGVEGVRMVRDIYDPASDKSVTHIQHEQHFASGGKVPQSRRGA